MTPTGRRVALLGSLVVFLALIAFVTLRTNRPSSLTVAIARGESPAAPEFALPRLDTAGTLSLASLRGKVVVVNFWASWCIPCKDEAPALEVTWQRYRDRGVVFVGVNVQDLTPKALAFLNETRATYPNVRDKDNTVYRAYGLTGVPETFFVSREGRIVKKFPGVVTDPETWARAVEDALAR
ncbi:MAG: redoxin domain-containing protein [Armatimonadota bacterium]|nr:redoxin domain-containing protein [Armatimonadota bacterium]